MAGLRANIGEIGVGFEPVRGGNFDPHLSRRDAIFPRGGIEKTYWYLYYVIRLPLWLLAVLCLAWPVTSFLTRRRRQGRGFEVEGVEAVAAMAATPEPRRGD